MVCFSGDIIEIDPLSSSNNIVQKAECLSSDNTIVVQYNPDDQTNNKNIKITDTDNGGKRISYTVNVPSNDYIESTFEYSTLYPQTVYDFQYTRYPIIDLNINTVFPNGYKLTIFPTLSSELKTISQGSTHKNFKVEGGILPRQGIIYILERTS